jgi:transposase InsO family protein
MIASGGKTWFTAAEIADLGLPGLPKTKRKVNERADAENWAVAIDDAGHPLARRRNARGGGTEYHVSLLPAAARAELAHRGMLFVITETNSADERRSDQWRWFDRQNEKTKAEAHRRLGMIEKIDMFVSAGLLISTAVAAVSVAEKIGKSTLWDYLGLIDGVTPADRLPALAPRRSGGGAAAQIDAELWQMLLSDFLRLSQPSWESCYRRAAEAAKERGLAIPHSRTLFRKLEAEVPPQVITIRRKGEEALRRMLPPQIRSVAEMHAMELVNIDGHRCDVFVRWPDGTIARPTLVAIQDVYSRKFLAWRVAESEDMVTARLVFADLFAKWGIPKGLLSDNGRAFASKWLTGGAKTRFRFKVREEEPTGVLTALGVKIHWAKPYRGQSKPIERGFRDFCDAIAKHPAFEGAYTGNSPLAKPENYASRAIDLDVFLQVWDAGIAEHNRRLGRRTEMGAGQRSFDEVFEESYVRSPIGKATDEQLRLALYAADQVSTDRKTGAVRLAGNSYWCEELAQIVGEKVTIRFDPEDLTKPVHVYDRAGRFLCTAPLWQATGFLDMAAAKDRQRLEKRHQKATREAEKALGLLSAAQLVEKLPTYDEEQAPPSPRPTITRMVRHRGQTAAALKAVSEPSQEALHTANVDRFTNAALRLIK